MMFKSRRCGYVRCRLSACIDGELSGKDMKIVLSHVESCSGCRRALDELKMLDPLLREYDVPSVPENLIKNIMTEAGRRTAGEFPGVRDVPAAWTARIGPAFSRAAVAAVLMIGLAAGSFFGWSAGRGKSAPSASDDPGSVNVEVVYSLDVFGAAPYGSIESAFAMAKNGGEEGK
ncbi:MAG: zf-HC2 domain-containing protein [bacterium]